MIMKKYFLLKDMLNIHLDYIFVKIFDYFKERKKIEYNEENKKKFLNDYLNEEKIKNDKPITWRKLYLNFMKGH